MKKESPDSARIKVMRYCAYQERSHKEVREKLYAMGLNKADVDMLCTELIAQNYLNEERFARSYAGGKFRIKQWGWRKIELSLKNKGVSDYCIKKAREEIDQTSYEESIRWLIEKKLASLKGGTEYEKKQKVLQYLLSRGFETDLVISCLKDF